MEKLEFENKMLQTQELERNTTDPDEQGYLQGFRRGLLRRFYGNFGSDEEHRAFMRMPKNPVGRGYMNAFAGMDVFLPDLKTA